MGTSVADLAPGLSRKLKKVQESRIDTPYLLSSLNTLSSFYDDNTPQARRNLRSTIEKRALSINCEFLDASHAAQLINALREEELNENFFKALSHVQEIHANCKVLLRTHHQRAGLELMDMMAVYQEGAYERLCRERSVLFKYCAEEVANMRHNALFRRFISALTRGGPGGLPRPIEVHAHDPLRYVGDMLGWLHQALASERELVAVLLDPDTITDSGPKQFSNNSEDGSGKTESDLMFVLDRIFEGSQPSLIVSYKLSSTLEFYCYTISDLLGRETALCNTLWALKDAAQNTFFDILKGRGEKLLRYPPLVAVDLSPPPAVTEGVSVLLEIIDNYNSMMVPASGQKPAFGPVISAILDPIVQMCEQAAEAHKSKGAGHSSRRSGMSFDCGQLTKSSVDAILSNSSSVSSSLVCSYSFSLKFYRYLLP
uniref:Conserved oligomeric Golgi complex subunit 6 n=1 Tax=Glycine max TaxID=3847 RepID=A0A0R0LBB8_SOYBN